MKSVLRTSALFAALLFVVSAAQAYNPVVKPLYAGQHILVGQLVVENDSRYLYVTYDMTKAPEGMTGFVPGWTMQTTHLYVGKSKPTSAAPGRFPFKHEGLNNVAVDTYKIKLSTLTEVRCLTTLYIAAHADTCAQNGPCVPDYASITGQFPTTLSGATLVDNQAVLNPGPNGTANWAAPATYTVVTAIGSYPAWCLDADGPIETGLEYQSIYEPSVAPDGTFSLAAAALLGTQAQSSTTKLSLLNYLLNQSYVRNCGATGNPYSARDIQLAIWVITNGYYEPATATTPEVMVIYKYNTSTQTYVTKPITAFVAGNVDNIRAILNDVDVNGPGYKPGCEAQLLVVVDPQTPAPAVSGYVHNQHMGFVLPLTGASTVQCETAWAKGPTRIGTGWGTYFTYPR